MWDIFCRVVDNYGDIGICWRLAQQFTQDHHQRIRLWVDVPATLAALCPTYRPEEPHQWVEGVEVCHWIEDFPPVILPEVVIAAFACDLPASYLAQMVSAPTPPFWVNLEYLSAESWVEGSHLMRSPLPRAPQCVQTFFFPGFSPKTGGLFKETGLLEKRRGFQAGLHCPSSNPLRVSLFAYEHAPFDALFEAFQNAPHPVHCLITAGKATEAVQALLKQRAFSNVVCTFLPFLSQDQYDELLWCCDLNFVRGEDSFVRAQWAGRPFIWHIYPQEEQAHLEKLTAFLNRYTADWPEAVKKPFLEFSREWNDDASTQLEKKWQALYPHLKMWTPYAEAWVETLETYGDVASHLVKWVNQEKDKKSMCELCETVGGDLLIQSEKWRIVLVEEADYPGFCRVIWTDHVAEMTDLSPADQADFFSAAIKTERCVRAVLSPDKINLASLGNMTPHLHWHVIPRFKTDPHFPQPIWGIRQRETASPTLPLDWKETLKLALTKAFKE